MSIRSHLANLFGPLASGGKSDHSDPSPLDYDAMIQLDAENLAEGGMAEAYELVVPHLRKYVPQPVDLEEVRDHDTPRYAVRIGTTEHVICAPELNENESSSWGRATYVLFHIINSQLRGQPVRFYAINGGNDLGGMFLTEDAARDAQSRLPRKSDWPYIPQPDPPWFGEFH
jgi:hypothetical protein